MINSPTKLDHRTLPRKKRAPTARDQAIYLAYKTTGVSQTKLAADNNLSQRRISEIVQRVERWRADLLPAAAGELDPRQSQRLERWLEQQRLQSIYDRAIRAYDTQPSELKTTRQGDRDGKPYHDETMREVPLNVQLLKVALRAAEDLGLLHDKPVPAAPDAKDAHQRFWKTHALIRELRRDNGVIEDPSLWSNESAEIAQALDKLIGKESATTRGVGVSPAQESGDTGVLPTPPIRSVSEEPDDVGCISAAQCTAIVSDNSDSALNFELGTLNSASPILSLEPGSNSSNRSNPAPPLMPESPLAASPDAASELPSPLDVPSAPWSRPAASRRCSLTPQKNHSAEQLSLAQRRRRHEELLEQYRAAQRSGLPYSFVFDSEDGPIPPPIYRLDGVGH